MSDVAAFEDFDQSGGSFLGAPWWSEDSSPSIGILGVPYDSGVHARRIGSRSGPEHIRFMSRDGRTQLSEYETDRYSSSRVYDFGNVRTVAGRPDTAYPAIEAATRTVLSTGARPISMGGDGAVTLPQLRAWADTVAHDNARVLHFDAHTDSLPGSGEAKYTNATTFTRAIEEGLVKAENCVHLGTRGTVPLPGTVQLAREMGSRVHTMDEILDTGISTLLTGMVAEFGDDPVYVCWDMDIFDPSAAPGVCTPEWGGWSAAEGIRVLRALGDFNVSYFDLNTVSPPHDVNDQTSSLAGRLLLEAIYLFAGKLGAS